MARIILLSGLAEIGLSAGNWQGWIEVSETGQNLQAALWEKKIPISNFFPFWRICIYFTYKINFPLLLHSWMLYIMVKGHYPTMPIVSNEVFNLKGFFYFFLVRCHFYILTKKKRQKKEKNPSFHFKTLQSALWHLENLSYISGGLEPGPAFLQLIPSRCQS